MKNALEKPPISKELIESNKIERSSLSLMPPISMELYLAFAYLCQGMAQQYGLIAQPIQFYMMKGLNLSAAQVSFYMAIMLIPWVIKPLFGMISDFIPIFGLRRKSYLLVGSIIASFAFIGLALSQSLPLVLSFLFIQAIGMSISVALLVGITVESGRNDNKTQTYFSYQGFCYYLANIAAALIGGFICQHALPLKAVNLSAAIALGLPLIFALVTFFVLKEKPRQNSKGIDITLLKEAFKSKKLLAIALFLWCFNFTPSFGITLYYYQSKHLGFSQAFIGQLGGWNSFGMLLGAIIFGTFVIKKLSLNQQLKLVILLGTVSTLSYLFLNSQSATALEIARGISSIIAVLTLYSLASAACPKYIEVSVMAIMITVWNLALEFSTFIGGQLYTYVLGEQFNWLICISAAFTGLCVFLLPLISENESSLGKAL